jgi:hypothetical protein
MVVIRFILSIVLAFVLALIIKSRSVGIAILIGTIFGRILHAVNFCGMAAVFPWFATARHWVSILSRVMSGAVHGWAHAARAHHGHSAHRVT